MAERAASRRARRRCAASARGKTTATSRAPAATRRWISSATSAISSAWRPADERWRPCGGLARPLRFRSPATPAQLSAGSASSSGRASTPSNSDQSSIHFSSAGCAPRHSGSGRTIVSSPQRRVSAARFQNSPQASAPSPKTSSRSARRGAEGSTNAARARPPRPAAAPARSPATPVQAASSPKMLAQGCKWKIRGGEAGRQQVAEILERPLRHRLAGSSIAFQRVSSVGSLGSGVCPARLRRPRSRSPGGKRRGQPLRRPKGDPLPPGEARRQEFDPEEGHSLAGAALLQGLRLAARRHDDVGPLELFAAAFEPGADRLAPRRFRMAEE